MVPEQTMKSGALLCYKKKEPNRGHNGKRELADRQIGTKILTCPLITDICLSNMVLSKPLSVCRGGKKRLLVGVLCHMSLCCQTALCLFNIIHLNRERQERRGKFSGALYLEHLIEVLTEALHKVHVREAGQHQVSGLLGEGNLSLGEPCPVEWV